MADLIELLQHHGREFNFLQAVSLLEEYYRKRDSDSAPIRSGRLHFESDPSIAFPSSDIACIKRERDSVRFLLTFLGLTGASSPLPNYFSDYIARHPENGQALADFCALFNHRIYALFFEALRKYRFAAAALRVPFSFGLRCLAGVASESGTGSKRMVAYAGVLSSRRRSARGLEALVSDLFGAIPVKVTPWVGRWVPLPNPSRLGQDSALGVNATVGTEVFDRSGKFRISLGPLDRPAFETFLEGSANVGLLRRVVASYSSDPLEFDIEVKLAVSELIAIRLGDTTARLGHTASLGASPFASGRESTIVLQGQAV